MVKLLPLLLTAGAMFAQTGSITSSGGSVSFPNTGGVSNVIVKETIAGSPTSATVVVRGCTSGGACSIVDTFQFAANGSTSRVVTTDTAYATFRVTSTWSGGSGVSTTVNTSFPKAGVLTTDFDPSSNSCVSGAQGLSYNGTIYTCQSGHYAARRGVPAYGRAAD